MPPGPEIKHTTTKLHCHHLALLLLTLLLLPTRTAASSTPASTPSAEDFGGGPIEPPRDLTTEEERAAIQAEVERNIAQLQRAGQLEGEEHLSFDRSEAVSFQWPLRAAANLTDYGYHGVSGYMDHDPVIDALLDYTCGDRTYDIPGYNHRGTDFFTYPFPWLKMDNSQVEIVAAAPGTLVFKRDGQYDRQCAMTGALSNAVVIRHADGTIAWYLHMKSGSVTDKPEGAAIAAGEYLGVVGSSGSSTGPHLHFEVRTASGDTSIDPFNGACNTTPSLWAEQPQYYDSAVIAVRTHSAPPYRPPCPGQETPNYQDTFAPDETVTFVTTYRDQLAGQTSTYSILKPDGALYRTWTHASSYEHYAASYWYWTKALDGDGPPPTGTWTFEVNFEGDTYTTTFEVVTPQVITVTHPNGGEAWPIPGLLPITWQDNIDGNVAVDLYAGGDFHSTIISATPSDGATFWGTGTGGLTPRRDYTLLIRDAEDPNTYDYSDAPFTLAPVPVAGFTLTPDSGIVPLTVAFTDTSTSLIDTWLWRFGDGITSTTQHPDHIYTDTGVYTVTLTVTGPTGSDTLTRTQAVTVTPPPLVTAFTAHPILGTPPLTVTFTDQTTGPPVDRWLWAFGDGVTATLQHPTHTYAEIGVYTVTLTTGAAEQEDVALKPRYIHVVDRLWHVYLPLVTRTQTSP